MKERTSISPISLVDSVILMVTIVLEISVCVNMGLSMPVPLFMAYVIIWCYCKIRRVDWEVVEGFALDGIRSGFSCVLIVAAVGCLIGTWIMAGTIPTIIYYGLEIISPSIFLPATVVLCGLLSLMTGTSYGSAASAGLACMGIGLSMGFPPGIVAGAVICGSLFGDKMSPFSDTTNICPAMAGGTLFGHIRAMCYSTIPGILITLVIFALLGGQHSNNNYDIAEVQSYMQGLSDNFNIGIVSILPMILVVVLLLFKVSATPAILLGALGGGVVAIATQGASVVDVFNVMHKGFKIESGIFLVDKLLNRGGIHSMMDIMLIMIFALGLGAMLDKLGVLDNFLRPFVSRCRSVFSLVLCTMLAGYATAAIGCTMAFSQVITGKLFAGIYRKQGVSPHVLSRALEDSGTLGTSLIPWCSSAIYFSGVLGVSYGEYIPYLFFNFLVPIISLVMVYFGFAVWYVDPESGEPIEKKDAPIVKCAMKK